MSYKVLRHQDFIDENEIGTLIGLVVVDTIASLSEIPANIRNEAQVIICEEDGAIYKWEAPNWVKKTQTQSYTDNEAINAITSILTDTNSINFTYANDQIKADVIKSGLGLTIIDINGLQAALDGKINIPDIIDNLTSAISNKPLSAKQGKVLKDLIDNITLILNSNDDTLDTLQKIVDYVKANRSTIESLSISDINGLQTALDDKILVADIIDNLTSAMSNKPLSANQGKILKDYIDAINSVLSSDDTALDELQEIVDFIKQNKEDLQKLGISNIAGLQSALDAKLNSVIAGTNVTIDNTDPKNPIINVTDMTNDWGEIGGTLSNQTDLQNALNGKQDTLVSGNNIKTINSESILGSGNIEVTGVSTFIALNDSPSEYTGNEGKLVKVNPTGDGLIFGDPSGSSVSWGDIQGTLTDQTDLKNELDTKQDTLTAGTNITIENNIISATGGTTSEFHLDGGRADSVYTAEQIINCGGA